MALESEIKIREATLLLQKVDKFLDTFPWPLDPETGLLTEKATKKRMEMREAFIELLDTFAQETRPKRGRPRRSHFG